MNASTPDEPVFSDRQARDEDLRAAALALPEADTLEMFEVQRPSPHLAYFLQLLLEETFTEMDRRANHAPELLRPLPGYQPHTPGTYGALTTPYVLQVMSEILYAGATMPASLTRLFPLSGDMPGPPSIESKRPVQSPARTLLLDV